MFVVKIIAVIILIIICLFLASFGIYLFNLDMKMMAALHPLLMKIHDRRKRSRRI